VSRYEIDKFMSYVEGSDRAVLDYVADPESYVAAWEERADGSRLPLPDAGSFTDQERSALVSRDHAELWRLGAHPYLLWHFVEAIRIWTGETTWPEMTKRFREDIAGMDNPGFAT
jgi:hypothetical protein